MHFIVTVVSDKSLAMVFFVARSKAEQPESLLKIVWLFAKDLESEEGANVFVGDRKKIGCRSTEE
jgi:hypothetical protein